MDELLQGVVDCKNCGAETNAPVKFATRQNYDTFRVESGLPAICSSCGIRAMYGRDDLRLKGG